MNTLAESLRVNMIKSDTLFVHVNIEYCLKRIINFIDVGIIYICMCKFTK